jgi:hypothetical protein
VLADAIENDACKAVRVDRYFADEDDPDAPVRG